jgi:hypothetical protein
MIERMEVRRHFAAQPVVAVAMTGTVDAVNGIILTFGMPLDPASAQNVEAYSISRRVKGKDSSFGGIDLGSSGGGARRVSFTSAVYDPAAQAVTLTPSVPFNLPKRFRRLRVGGTGTNAVNDATGAPIDGDGDGTPGGSNVIHVRVGRSKHFNYKEADGDVGRFRLAGPGRLWAFADKRRTVAPVIFLSDANPQKSRLIGSVVRNPRSGDGVVTIHQLTGASSASTPLLADPAFRIEVVNP